MVHAIGLGVLWGGGLLLGGCSMPMSGEPGSLAGLNARWYYVPGPYQTRQRINGVTRDASVSVEVDGAWTVTISQPPTTIIVKRLADGRPATASISDAERNETAFFEPPLALTPKPGQAAPATEASRVTLHRGLITGGVPAGQKPARSGTAERRFLGVESGTWSLDGRIYLAQILRHELVLSIGPAEVHQRYESMAVEGLGIVRESMVERVGVLGVRVSGHEEVVEVVEFIDWR